MADNPYPLGRYRLREKAYLPRVPGAMSEVLGEGQEVTFDGPPGAHMEPLDDAARAAVERADKEKRLGTLDPVASLDLTMQPDEIRAALEEKIVTMKRQQAAAEAARQAGAVSAPTVSAPAPSLLGPPPSQTLMPAASSPTPPPLPPPLPGH